jgi:hypothetical protein
VLVLKDGLLYGSDDRVELFEAEELNRSLGTSVVALGLRSEIAEDAPGVLSVLSPSWAERAGLCDGERFAAQPSFALCTGVAIGTDLVLTAAHCTRAAALDELAVVTGYAYQGPDDLKLASDGRVHAVEEVLASDSYWDYAWLRVQPGLAPLQPERLAPSPISNGMGIFSINHGGGLPAKVDAGGAAYLLNADELVTTLDALGGASGGPVFSDEGTLIGTLTAGGSDYALTGSSCSIVATGPDLPDAANELVVGLDVSVDALCSAAPSDAALWGRCQDPVGSRQRPEPESCATTPYPFFFSAPRAWLWGLLLLCAVVARRLCA